MKNHDDMLTKLRFNVGTGQWKKLTEFKTECFRYIFTKELSGNSLKKFVDFLGNSDNLNSTSPLEFFLFFNENDIPFRFAWKYDSKIALKRNVLELKICIKANRCMNLIRKKEKINMKIKEDNRNVETKSFETHTDLCKSKLHET